MKPLTFNNLLKRRKTRERNNQFALSDKMDTFLASKVCNPLQNSLVGPQPSPLEPHGTCVPLQTSHGLSQVTASEQLMHNEPHAARYMVKRLGA
jgi:hypothetical protein